jgi:hypothetical protein
MMKLQKTKNKGAKKPPKSTKQTCNLGDDTKKTSLNAQRNKL